MIADLMFSEPLTLLTLAAVAWTALLVVVAWQGSNR